MLRPGLPPWGGAARSPPPHSPSGRPRSPPPRPRSAPGRRGQPQAHSADEETVVACGSVLSVGEPRARGSEGRQPGSAELGRPRGPRAATGCRVRVSEPFQALLGPGKLQNGGVHRRASCPPTPNYAKGDPGLEGTQKPVDKRVSSGAGNLIFPSFDICAFFIFSKCPVSRWLFFKQPGVY